MIRSAKTVNCAAVIAMIVLTCASVSAQNIAEEFKLAAGLYQRGQWIEAATAFQKILADYPNTDEAVRSRFFWAETAMQRGEYRLAYQQYQSFLKTHPDHVLAARATFRMGESALQDDNQSIALRLLEEFARRHPSHPLNHYALAYLGRLRLDRGEPQLALRVFQASLEAFPDGPKSPESYLGTGKALLAQGAIEAAAEIFQYAIANYTENQPLVADAKIHLGLKHLQAVPIELSAAEKLFQEVIQNPATPELEAGAALELARLFNQTDRETETLKSLEPLLGREYRTQLKTELLFEYAVAAARGDQLDLAVNTLEKIRSTTQNRESLTAAVQLEIKLLQVSDQLEQALRLAKQYQLDADIRSLNNELLERLGRQQFTDNQYHESLKVFDGLIQSGDSDTIRLMTWRYFKALNLIGLQRLQRAETTLKKIDLAAADDKLRSLAEFCLASVNFRQQKFAAAIPYYQNYLAQTAQSADRDQANLELAISLAENRQPQAAGQRLQLILDSQTPSEKLEIAIERVAQLAIPLHRETALTWYQWLADHGQNDVRRARADSQLVSIRLDGPQQRQTVAVFEKLFLTNAGNPRLVAAAVARATAFEQSQQLPQAIKMYRLVIDDPDQQSAVVDASRLKLAKLYQQQGDPNSLRLAAEQLTAWLSRSISQTPSINAEIIYQLAWLQRDLGQATAAEQSFQRLVDNYTDSKFWPDAAYRLIQTYYDRGQLDDVHALAHRVLESDNVPRDVEARLQYQLGKIAIKEKRWPAVQDAMSRAAELLEPSATQATANYLYAEALFQQDKNTAALECFEKLNANLELHPTQYQPWIELRFATLLFRQGRVTRAKLTAATARDRYVEFNSSFEFEFVVGQCLETKGLLDDARQAFLKVVNSANGKSTETAAHAQWRIGETFFHQENYQRAIAAYYKVDSLYDYPRWRAAALLQAGKCQEHLANPQQAATLYRKLLQRYPDSQFADPTQQRLDNLASANAQTAKQISQQNY